jgi:hypothetical protein
MQATKSAIAELHGEDNQEATSSLKAAFSLTAGLVMSNVAVCIVLYLIYVIIG